MKRISAFLLTILALSSITAAAQQKVFEIATDHSSLVYTLDQNEKLIWRYFGNKLSCPEDFCKIKGYNRPDTKKEMVSEAYPSFGLGYENEPAFYAVNHDGSPINNFHFKDYLEHGNKKTFVLTDRKYGLDIKLHFRCYPAEDIIVQWAEIINREKGTVTLKNCYSSFLNLQANRYYLTHFYGNWASEMQLEEEELTYGIKAIESKKGVRTTQTENASFLLSLDHPSTEKEGACIGGALAWSGNWKLSFEVDDRNRLNILSGTNPFMSDYQLKKGESLVTPEFIFTYSNEGRGKVSRSFHDWARRYNLHAGFEERPVILNSWEGAYFKFNENVITSMIDDAADLGVELFVLDDGWFGNKYPRDSDKMGLGDWQVNSRKLPHGIQHLIDHAHSRGIKFGIWIEPEMVNPQSKLAERHPEWIVNSPQREKRTLRNQLLLDLTNPKVQDFIWNMIDDLLSQNKGIDYIKWDANRNVDQLGSTYLNDDEQMHFWIDYTRGLYNIYEKIRTKYPHLMMQQCASGGGRLDFGALKYHDEFWTSDNTDALQRIYIQYATNLIYPPVATASHVSASPSHQTRNVIPLKFRFDVAMGGRLGMELQPKDMTPEEMTFAKNAIECYKKNVRRIVTKGDLYRLISPYECKQHHAANIYVSKEKSEAVFMAYCTGYNRRNILPTIKLDGLDPEKTYRITEINKNSKKKSFWGDGTTFSGDYLMKAGIELQIARQYESAIFLLTEVE